MLDINFEINGRKINKDNVKDSLEAAMIKAVSDQIVQAVGEMRCPDHGEAPKILCTGKEFTDISIEVPSSCCGKLLGMVRGKLSV